MSGITHSLSVRPGSDDENQRHRRHKHARSRQTLEGQGAPSLDPTELSILEMAEKVIELTGSRSKIVFQPLPADDPMHRRPDIALAKKEFGWQPTVSLDDGLKATIGVSNSRSAPRLRGSHRRRRCERQPPAPEATPNSSPAAIQAAGGTATDRASSFALRKLLTF